MLCGALKCALESDEANSLRLGERVGQLEREPLGDATDSGRVPLGGRQQQTGTRSSQSSATRLENERASRSWGVAEAGKAPASSTGSSAGRRAGFRPRRGAVSPRPQARPAYCAGAGAASSASGSSSTRTKASNGVGRPRRTTTRKASRSPIRRRAANASASADARSSQSHRPARRAPASLLRPRPAGRKENLR